MYNTDQYRWLDRTLVASGYTNWCSCNGGEPSHGAQNYIRLAPIDREWADHYGHIQYKYICELGLI